MTRMTLAATLPHRAGSFLRSHWKWLPLPGLLVLAAITISCAMSTCEQPGPKVPSQVVPTAQGVPVIRVKLTPKPAEPVIATTGGYNLFCDGRLVAQSPSALPAVTITRFGNTWSIGNQSFSGGIAELQVAPTTLVRYGPANMTYRGNLRLVPTPDGQYAVVNCLDMESYLAGVLAKELRTTWSDATYQALAVAARTFARYMSVTAGQNNYFDVTDDQASQVYGGYSAETPRSRAAVAATCGQMLVAGPAGHEVLFLAQYSAACGGRVNSASVIRNAEPLAPLQGGQVCDDCSACSRYRWAPVRVTKADVYKALLAAYPEKTAPLTAVNDVRVASYTPYGRIMWLDVIGKPGAEPLRLRADDMRLALIRYKNSSGVSPAATIYSMNCQIRVVGDSIEFYDGKGFGHGVGLCQWGAEGKAQKGWSGLEILNFYYPGAQVRTFWKS